MAILGAAAVVAPVFVKNPASKKKLEEIEEAAGEAIGEITRP
jgi:hypothetical protein